MYIIYMYSILNTCIVLSPFFSPVFHDPLWRLVCAGSHQHGHFYHRVTTAATGALDGIMW